jgi:NADP-dependent 3-hydroxy acid dehydrogenase YdfG
VCGPLHCKYLAENGAKIAILGRKEDVGNALVEEIKNESGVAKFYKTDVMDINIVKQNCEDILKDFGRVDTLLNAAGGNMKAPPSRPTRLSLTSTQRNSRPCSISTSRER